MQDVGESCVRQLSARVPGLGALQALTLGRHDVCIAVLDDVVDLRHACLAGAALHEIPLDPAAADAPSVPSAHGTHVAGILFGQPSSALPGVAPGCRGFSLPIYSGGDSGVPMGCSEQTLAGAVHSALTLGADIINISGGQPSADGQSSAELDAALQACSDAGVLVVAAVGNDGCACLQLPAAHSTVLAVGAVDDDAMPLCFSNYSSAYRERGVLALGGDVPGPIPRGLLRTASGTSYATALVSGVAALLLSLERASSSACTARDIGELVLASARACGSEAPGAYSRAFLGVLDISAALALRQQRAQARTHARSALLREFDSEAARAPGESFAALEPTRDRRTLSQPPAAYDIHEDQTMTTDTLVSPADTSPVPEPVASATRPSSDHSARGRLTSPLVTPAAAASGHECTCQSAPPSLAYAIGKLGVDFGSRQRRDSLAADVGGDPSDLQVLLSYLQVTPHAASEVIWTLEVDAVPLYAIRPEGAFASEAYARLRELLLQQLSGVVQRVSIPGVVQGSQRLQSTSTVPVLAPVLRGIVGWDSEAILARAVQQLPPNEQGPRRAQFRNVIDRFFHELRNAGVEPRDRALNAAATSLFRMTEVFASKIAEDLVLDRAQVARSLVCPPGSECWDVSLVFFHPKQMTERAREVFRFTLDVGHPIPVRLGEIGTWATHAFGG